MRVVEAGSQVDGSRAQMDGLHIRTELVWNDFKLLHAELGFSFLASVLVLDPRSSREQASFCCRHLLIKHNNKQHTSNK